MDQLPDTKTDAEQPDLIRNIKICEDDGTEPACPRAAKENETKAASITSTTSSIDIIGDFGKEIEKEIGLIVSGYKNKMVEAIVSPTKIEEEAEQVNIDDTLKKVSEI